MNKKIKKTEVIETDLFEDYSKELKNNPAKLKAFQKQIIKEYNETKDIALFLENLKIVAMAKGNIADLAKKSKVQRHSVYNILSKSGNPLLFNALNLIHNLGIDFIAKQAA